MKNDMSRCRLGIAVTTYNRREAVCRQITEIRRLTSMPFDLVICDDGSSDGTQEALRDLGVTAVCGVNRGIAWNKNRGIFYLMGVLGCDVAILLDDDVLPVEARWEARWVEGAVKLGHVNLVIPDLVPEVDARSCSPAAPGLIPKLLGACMAFQRYPWSMVGYMDARFGRYGHEHTEFTNRFLRNGFGGFPRGALDLPENRYLVIGGGVELIDVTGHGTKEEIEANDLIWSAIKRENAHTYRAPWIDDKQRFEFLSEIRIGALASGLELPWLLQEAAFGPV